MKVNIEELITINYELEGLLYLALHRGDDTPEQVWSLISDKIESLKDGIRPDDLAIELTGKPQATEEFSPVATNLTEDETAAETEVSMECPEAPCQAFEDEEVITTADTPEGVVASPAVVEEVIANADTPEDVTAFPVLVEEVITTADIPEEAIESPALVEEVITTADIPEETIESPAFAASDNIVEAQDQEEIILNDTIEENETESENDTDARIEEPTPAIPTPAPQPIRLDEKLARQSSRDLRKAFSLNDRFRFRRELFGNSDPEMNDTLNLLSLIHISEPTRRS